MSPCEKHSLNYEWCQEIVVCACGDILNFKLRSVKYGGLTQGLF